MLLELARRPGVDTVVLSHYREKQYGRATVELLSAIVGLARLIDRLANRAPAPHFPHLSRRQVATKCGACPFNPHVLYPRLRNTLLEDIGRFYDTFSSAAEKLEVYREPGCRTCTRDTHEDFVFLFGRTLEVGESAVRSAEEDPGAQQ